VNAPSLLSFLDAPIVVGDPDGRAAYVNPAFEGCFAVSAQAIKGQPLAQLFEGGVREAVLGAVAEVCEQGTSTRFRVRHAGVGYAGMASPIVAQDARVGFVILLFENTAEHERVHTLHRQLAQPVEELSRLLDEACEQRHSPEKLEPLLEEGQRVLERLSRASSEIATLLSGRRGGADEEGYDPAPVARQVAQRMLEEFEGPGVRFEAHIPGRLPALRGEPARLEAMLLQLLRSRLTVCGSGSEVSLAAGALERHGVPSVVFRAMHRPADATGHETWAEPDAVVRLVHELDGELRVRVDRNGSFATAIRLTALSL
jgi:PAS domain-containing protein